MSRTVRKQTGNRYWRNAHRSKYNYNYKKFNYSGYFFNHSEVIPMLWEEVETEMKLDIIKHEKKDGHWHNSINPNVKWHSNKLVRSSNRRELHRVMKDPLNYEYNRSHDIKKKGLWWVYN